MNHQKFGTWEEAITWLITQPEQQGLVQACYYDAPLLLAAERYYKSNEWQAIQTFLPCLDREGIVLDLGAGNGITSYALAKTGWKVTALEPDSSNLVGVGAIRQLSQDAQLSIEVVQEFGEALPFPDQSFDLVFARQVMHHAQNLQQLCREIDRVLKPGGAFIAVRDHVISTQRDLPKFLDAHPLHKLYGGENAYLLKEYTQAIERVGLKIDQVLGAFDSVINYAPRTEAELKRELQKKLERFPAGQFFGKFVLNRSLFPSLLKLLSILDQRPGRPYSFICRKP